MMTLDLMQQVVRTLNDNQQSPLADKLVQFWGNDGSRPTYFRASANFVFFFKTDQGQRAVLRFNHESERDLSAVEAELAIVEHLAGMGASVARPIKSKTGDLTHVAETEHGIFYVTAFEHISGEQGDVGEGLSEARWHAWGHALGVLHNGFSRFSGLAKPERPSWKEHVVQIATAFSDEPQICDSLERVSAALRALPQDAGNFGLIHFDFEQDNIIWRGDEAVAIDFDDCAYYWYATDIAYALRDLYDDNASKVAFDDPRLQLFVAGYREVRELHDDDLANLPLFMRFHHLVWLMRLKHSLTAPLEDEPDWVPRLRAHLTGIAKEYRAILGAA